MRQTVGQFKMVKRVYIEQVIPLSFAGILKGWLILCSWIQNLYWWVSYEIVCTLQNLTLRMIQCMRLYLTIFQKTRPKSYLLTWRQLSMSFSLYDVKTYYCILESPMCVTCFQVYISIFSEDRQNRENDQHNKNQIPKKKRKTRTAFTNQQIYELEKRFILQKYLTPSDRDEIAAKLGLTCAQVITWFQNRRAKFKRDIEELKNDVGATSPKGSDN